MIDSSDNGRYGYWFMVVLGGTLADGHLMPERRFSSNWDGPGAAKPARPKRAGPSRCSCPGP